MPQEFLKFSTYSLIWKIQNKWQVINSQDKCKDPIILQVYKIHSWKGNRDRSLLPTISAKGPWIYRFRRPTHESVLYFSTKAALYFVRYQIAHLVVHPRIKKTLIELQGSAMSWDATFTWCCLAVRCEVGVLNTKFSGTFQSLLIAIVWDTEGKFIRPKLGTKMSYFVHVKNSASCLCGSCGVLEALHNPLYAECGSFYCGKRWLWGKLPVMKQS